MNCELDGRRWEDIDDVVVTVITKTTSDLLQLHQGHRQTTQKYIQIETGGGQGHGVTHVEP